MGQKPGTVRSLLMETQQGGVVAEEREKGMLAIACIWGEEDGMGEVTEVCL